MKSVTQAEFARILGFSRSAVTQLKNAGRLVLDENGLVLVDESKIRIRDTADPNRDDVAARHRKGRAGRHDESDHATAKSGFQEFRALKENYLALHAKIDYEIRIGELVEREKVDRDWINVATILRTSLEKMSDTLSGVLAAESDQSRVHLILTDQIETILNSISEKVKTLSR